MREMILLMVMGLSNAGASIVDVTPAKESLMGIGLSTKVSYLGTSLALTGVGVGKKKVALSRVNVAVNQFFSERPDNFVRTLDGALTSVPSLGKMVMMITFVRAVSGDDVRAQINSYLNANLTVDDRAKYINELFSVTNAMSETQSIFYGKTVTLLMDPSNHEILYENADSKVTHIKVSDNNFMIKAVSPWLGVTINQDSFNLKNWLLDKPTVTEAHL